MCELEDLRLGDADAPRRGDPGELLGLDPVFERLQLLLPAPVFDDGDEVVLEAAERLAELVAVLPDLAGVEPREDLVYLSLNGIELALDVLLLDLDLFGQGSQGVVMQCRVFLEVQLERVVHQQNQFPHGYPQFLPSSGVPSRSASALQQG